MKKSIKAFCLVVILLCCGGTVTGQDKQSEAGVSDKNPVIDEKKASPSASTSEGSKKNTGPEKQVEDSSSKKASAGKEEAASAGAKDPLQEHGLSYNKDSLVPRMMSFMKLGIDWVLWLLFGLGGISALVLIERLVYFSVYGGKISQTRAELVSLLAEGDFEKAKNSFNFKKNIAGRVISEALQHAHRAPEAVQEIVESRLMEERQRLERGLSFVGTVGSNAPFIGLFGTVLGIIKAFHDLSLADQAGTSVVMVGISEALVATAVGLLVAIPSVVIFNVFKTRTKSILYGTESIFKLFLSRQLDICLNREESSNSASEKSSSRT